MKLVIRGRSRRNDVTFLLKLRNGEVHLAPGSIKRAGPKSSGTRKTTRETTTKASRISGGIKRINGVEIPSQGGEVVATGGQVIREIRVEANK